MKSIFKKSQDMTEILLEKNRIGGSFIDDLSGYLEDFLEDFAMEDGFGTERQLDPRGDGREGQFSMYDVSGVSVNTQRARNEVVLKRLFKIFSNEEDQILAQCFLDNEELSYLAE